MSCWGANDQGQLGTGAIGAPVAEPVTVVGLHDAVEVSAGSGFGCALRRDGRVSCWGSNDRGQLGDGTVTARLEPVPVTALRP